MKSHERNRRPSATPEFWQDVGMWSNAVRGRDELCLEIPPSIFLDEGLHFQSIAPDQIVRDLNSGYRVRRDEDTNDDNHYWIIGSSFSYRVQVVSDPVQAGQRLRLKEMVHHSRTHLKLKPGRWLVITPIKVLHFMHVHFLPWTSLPDNLKTYKDLLALFDNGATYCEVQRNEDPTYHAYTPEYAFKLEPLSVLESAPVQFAITEVVALNGLLPEELQESPETKKQKLGRGAVSVHPQLDMVFPPEILSAELVPPDADGGVAFDTLNLSNPTHLRKPFASELNGLSSTASERMSWLDGLDKILREDCFIVQYEREDRRLAVVVRPVISTLSAAPYLAVEKFWVDNDPGNRPLGFYWVLHRPAITAVSQLALSLTDTQMDKHWRSRGISSPSVEDVWSDLEEGFVMQNFRDAKSSQSGIKVNTNNYHLIVRPDRQAPREISPGVPVMIPTLIAKSIGSFTKFVKIGSEQPPPPSSFDIENALPSDPDQRMDHMLNKHYRFVSHFSEQLAARDEVPSNSDNVPTKSVRVRIRGIRDKTRDSIDHCLPRIAKSLHKRTACILVEMTEKPRNGVFTDGAIIRLYDKDEMRGQFEISVVSRNEVLLKPDKRNRKSSSSKKPEEVEFPISEGDELELARRRSYETGRLANQIGHLKEARYLAASQEDFARVVITPDRLTGQFDPSSEIEAVLSRMAQKNATSNKLNKEQQIAVSKAARTPHALFIKGPPGTGKTQVISQLVGLLASRGERVLLVSGQNKPLSDALERISDIYGVVPTRLSGNPDALTANDLELMWNNLIPSLRLGIKRAIIQPAHQDPTIANLHSLWLNTLGMHTGLTFERLLEVIDDLVSACLKEVNLMAVTIGSLVKYLETYRSGIRKGQTEAPQFDPDFFTPFDTLIIDEASRIRDEEFVTAALRCRRWILVGDEQQLPPFVDSNDAAYFHAMSALYLLEKHPDLQIDAMTGLADSEANDGQKLDEEQLLEHVHRAVEIIGNLWFEEPGRGLVEPEKVQDTALALLEQGAWMAPLSTNNDQLLKWNFLALVERLSHHIARPQLPNDTSDISEEEKKHHNHERVKYHLNCLRNVQTEYAKFGVRSFFERGYAETITSHDKAVHHEAFRVTLRQQYRMLPALADLVNEPIYQGTFSSDQFDEEKYAPVMPLVLDTFPDPVHFLDTALLGRLAKCQEAGTSWCNKTEARLTVKSLQKIVSETPKDERLSVMVLSPYSGQTDYLRDLIIEELGLDSIDGCPPELGSLRIENIDGAQGGEADIIILNFVRVSMDGLPPAQFAMFVQDLRRLNVALTRARRKLIMIGHSQTLQNLCSFEQVQDFFDHVFTTPGLIRRHMPFRFDEMEEKTIAVESQVGAHE